MDYASPTLADALASQYVTGTLRGRARARFESLLPGHPALQHAVRHWQERLMPLTTVLPEKQPSAAVWQRIEQQIWPTPAAAAAQPAAPWWGRLGLWRGVSALATAAALALVVMVASPPPALAPVVVVLQSTGGLPAVGGSFVASFSGDGRAVTARPLTPVALQNDRVLQLWSAPAQGAPTSLGVVKSDGATVLSRDKLTDSLLKGVDHLAVSVEPPGGSPTGQPTGPVVYYGKLQL